MTNEKNKYLSIFESMPTPAIILDEDHRCVNMNYAAQQLLQESALSPGHIYYSNLPRQPLLSEAMPWIYDEYMDFFQSDAPEKNFETVFESAAHGNRSLVVKFRKMLDVSYRYGGTVVLLTDLTEYKKIEEQLRLLSFHDQLTGLYNRVYMEEELRRLVTGRMNPVGFISMDIDGLKLVNDNLGHHAGDNLLFTVGRILKNCFRECDVIVRMGGDEFIILLPFSDSETVQAASQRIREKMDSYNMDSTLMPIGVSIGWSVANLYLSGDATDAIKEADSRMYMEKPGNHTEYERIFKHWLESGTKQQYALAGDRL